MPSGSSKLIVDVPMHVRVRWVPRHESRKRLGAYRLIEDTIQYSVRRTVSNEHGARIHLRLQSHQICFDRALRSFIDAAHEWKRKLVTYEIESSEIDPASVNGSVMRQLALQLHQVIVAHDVENRLTEVLEGNQHPIPIGFLSSFGCVESVRTSKKITRQYHSRWLPRPRNIDEPMVDIVEPMDICRGQYLHKFARRSFRPRFRGYRSRSLQDAGARTA